MTKPTGYSQTHCQAAQVNAQTQAWQRVWQRHRTTKTTDKPTGEKEHRSDNSLYSAIVGEVVNRRSAYPKKFELSGQESAFNLRVHIYANHSSQLGKRKNRLYLKSQSST